MSNTSTEIQGHCKDSSILFVTTYRWSLSLARADILVIGHVDNYPTMIGYDENAE